MVFGLVLQLILSVLKVLKAHRAQQDLKVLQVHKVLKDQQAQPDHKVLKVLKAHKALRA
jgi:hypothetical protein